MSNRPTGNRRFVAGLCVVVGALALAAPANAQVRYHYRDAPVDFFSPYDESYGTSPSFQIYPNPYGYAPGVRVVEHCQYPNGWNVTDFGRDLNGIPNGLDHQCPAPVYRGRVRAGY